MPQAVHSLTSRLRRKKKEKDDAAKDCDGDKDNCGKGSDTANATDSNKAAASSSIGPSNGRDRSKEGLAAAVGAALLVASEQLDALRRQLHAWQLEQQQQLQQSHAEALPEELPTQQLPVTELSANAVSAAAKKRLRDVAGKPPEIAEDQLAHAEAGVEAFVDREVEGMFQQQMQHQILLLLQAFFSRGSAADTTGAAAASSEEGRGTSAATPEHRLEAAAVAVTQQFNALVQQCVPSPQVRERWRCSALQQLLQQQLLQQAQRMQQQRSEQQQQAETLLRVVQQQHGLVQQLQQQLQQEHQPRPFSLGAAYRVPDSNLQLSAAMRQGRLQVNVTCVPDDAPAAASGVLGQHGFVKGIEGLGNLGISCSFSV
ncbi:putative uncharacterized protein DDB_G0271606 [Cyclospora cayetanensis]|uniref:Uncharacterized protein n=1 Tax=Cyclospora cayetanensis TaxID=88456 RepID=A0A6P6RYE9_9EIME|nr:putative uncharacterized protein DDB_G0271606 [Cyclospora cayetanensis]